MSEVRKAKGFTAIEELEAPSCNLAKIKLTPGFEANRKWKVNTRSDMAVRIISGEAAIEIGNNGLIFLSTKLQRSVFVPKNFIYRWIVESKRGITFYVFATPAWTPEQYQDAF